MKRWLLLSIAFVLAAVTFAVPAAAAPTGPASTSVSANDGAPIALAAPSAPQFQINPALASAEVLGQTSKVCDVPLLGGIIKQVCRTVTNTVDVGLNCLTPAVLVNFSGCKDQIAQLGDSVIDLVGAGISAIHKKIILAVNMATRDAAVYMAKWTLGNLLASDNELSSPDVTQEWFVEQASLLRNIGIFLIGPLMMIVVMQAIVKGSLFFLMRSALVMLPVAILGSAVLIKFTDLMINVADDMSAAIGSSVLGGNGDVLTTNLSEMDPRAMGFFSLIWLVMLLFGSVAIIIELLLRETGIYLAAFFLPMAFAALVWPSTSKWARRMVEVLLGLIFSKVFITAALTLGLAGMANIDDDTTGNTTINGEAVQAVANTEKGTASAAVVSSLFILAAFAGAKIISLSPGGDLALNQGRVANTSAAWQKGQAMSAVAGTAAKRAQSALAGVKPGGPWKSGNANNGSGAGGGSTVPVKGGPGNGGGGNRQQQPGGQRVAGQSKAATGAASGRPGVGAPPAPGVARVAGQSKSGGANGGPSSPPPSAARAAATGRPSTPGNSAASKARRASASSTARQGPKKSVAGQKRRPPRP